MSKINLNIAGEKVPVLFDGTRVTSPDFPDIEMEFFAQCGHKIGQQMLVDICKQKLAAQN
jgi:hypothetical protein